MNKTLICRTAQGLRHLLANLHDARYVRRAARVAHDRIKRSSSHKLHSDIGHSIGDAVGINLRNIRVDKTRCCLRFLLEALHKLCVCAVFLEHHLDGHRAIKHLIAAHIYTAHTALAKLALKKEITILAKNARRLNQLHIIHFIAPHLGFTIGQKTHAALPVTFASGTAPQYLLSKLLSELSPQVKYSSSPISTGPFIA